MCREDAEGKSTGGLLSKLSGVVGGLGGSRHGSRHNAESGSMRGSRGRVPSKTVALARMPALDRVAVLPSVQGLPPSSWW